MKKAKRFLGAALSLCIAAGVTAPLSGNYVADAASGPVVEYLDRGVSAVNTGSGMLVSWRYLANDDDNAVFKLYRDDTLIIQVMPVMQPAGLMRKVLRHRHIRLKRSWAVRLYQPTKAQ